MSKPAANARFARLAIMLCTLGVSHVGADATQPEIDPATGMKIAPGWETVRNNCIACHSPRQFLRQKGTAVTWTEIIRWMQKSGGLWALTADTEATIVDYLSQNYGPSGDYRRAPIPATLLPENPYVSETRQAYEKAGQGQPGKQPEP